MKIKDLIKEELRRRAEGDTISGEELVELVEKRIERKIETKLEKLPQRIYHEFIVPLKDKDIRVAVEKKYNGFRAMIHRKGDTVKIFSDQNKDITFPFPTIVEQAKKLTPKDFILDCELVPYVDGKPMGRDYTARYIGAVKSKKEIDDSNVRFFAFDILYLDKPLISLQWYERKKILDTLSWTKNIKEAKSYVVNNRFDLKRIVEKLSELEGSEGAIIKRFDGVYSPGKESDAWIKYRVEIPLELVVLGELPVKGSEDTVRYQLGIYLRQEETKRIDPKYLTKLNNRYVLQLGNSFNTNIEANRGDILLVSVEEIWRHKKGNKYHYSLHKPRVRKRLDKESSSSLNYLEEKVVSRGYEIIESEFEFRKEKNDEGREIEIADFPKRLQNNFKELKNEWMPYVIHWHYRGHRISRKEREKENIDDKYIYKLDSLHADARHLTRRGYLEGFTILSPTSTDLNVPDNLVKGESARKGRIRVVLKLIEPCLHPDTFVITDSGFKKAKNVTKEDKILNRYGHFEEITHITTGETNEFYEIKARGGIPLKVTSEHPFLIASFGEPLNQANMSHSERSLLSYNYKLIWKKAYELKQGDILLFPKINLATAVNNYPGYEKGRIIGKFIADGNLWNKNGITLAFDPHKKGIIDEWSELLDKYKNHKVCKVASRTCTLLNITNVGIRKIAEQCYDSSKIKCIPKQFIKIKSQFTDGLIDGLVEGDGYIDGKTKHLINTSPLVVGALSLMLLGRDIQPILRYRDNTTAPIGDQLVRNRKKIFEIQWMDNRINNSWFDLGDYYGLKLCSIKKVKESSEYYNIVTKDTHTICLPFAITHNSSWLRVKGIADIGEPGSTPTAPGVFVIVSKGKYRVHEVTDHKIRIEYKSERGNIDLSPLKKAEKKGILIERYPGRQLKDLTGVWQYQIAHIGDRHIILLRLLEDKKTNKLDEEIEKKIDEFSLRTNQLNKEQMREVINLTLDGVLTRPEIARKYDVSKNLIYRLQKTCNLI